MATKPALDAKWAETLQWELGLFDGVPASVPNKSTLPSAFEETGFLLDQGPARQYINQVINLLCLWQRHLNERYAIGDVHLTISAEDATTISARLGGTWVQRGTQAIGTITAKVWEKTA